MKIKHIKVTYGRTVQLIRYEPSRFDCEMSADIEEGDDVRKCCDDLRAQAKTQINQWIKFEQRAINSNLDDDIPY